MGMGMGKMGMGMGKMGMMGMGGGDEGGDDAAAAVGDPHLTTSTGEQADLAPEDLALAQGDEDLNLGKMGMGMGMMGMGKMGMMGMGMGKMGMMGMMGMGGDDVVVDPAVDEEAAAVGDPHLTLSTGELKDLSSDDLALTQSKDDQPRGMGMGMGMGMGKMGMGMMGMMGMGGGDEGDDAAAVGDPHLTRSTGEQEDLVPEDLALAQGDEDLGKMGMGMGKT